MLVPHAARQIVDSSGYDGRKVRLRRAGADPGGHPAADGDATGWWWSGSRYPDGRAVTLVADDRLFRNRTLRRTSAGELVLGLVAPRYRRVVVDEFHHGYQARGLARRGRIRLEHALAAGDGSCGSSPPSA